jgi:hypothetical protein
VWLNGTTSPFQGESRGSIPLTRSRVRCGASDPSLIPLQNLPVRLAKQGDSSDPPPNTMKDVLLLISALVTVFAVIPYIRDILRHKTKPNVASWITWTLLFLVASIAEIAAHEYRTAFFTGSVALECFIVVLLGSRYGYAKYTKFDAVCQISALLGFVVWWIFNNPLAAIFSVVVIDLLACLPTLEHSWFSPKEETWQTFAFSGIGALIALLALTSFNWTSVLYPVYLILINTLITSVIIFRRNTSKLSIPT